MNDKISQKRRTFIGKSTMPKKQTFEIPKLHNGKISSKGSLIAFLPNNTNTYICSLDHSNIITTIANT
jgi:hypothetical protein